MRFAFADPPYIGQAKKHYDCPEVNHAALIERLVADYPDGWVLCLSSPTLREILNLCPTDVRVGAWVKPFASFKPGVNPAYAWEPVIWRGGRKRDRTEPTVRDWVSASITLKKGLAGAKPPTFCDWVMDLLGTTDEDEWDDLFPGTGVFGARRSEVLSRREPSGNAGAGIAETATREVDQKRPTAGEPESHSVPAPALRRVWKPLDVGGLRLYEVLATYPSERHPTRYVVAATAPRDAARLIDEIMEGVEPRPSTAGFALNILQPKGWWVDGVQVGSREPDAPWNLGPDQEDPIPGNWLTDGKRSIWLGACDFNDAECDAIRDALNRVSRAASSAEPEKNTP